MFGIQFYPTSKETLELMLKPHIKEYEGRYGGTHRYLKLGKNLLEPSAGKGNIVDYICSFGGYKERNISVIEIDPNLQSILVDKDYKLIETDLLEYSGHYYFDFIIMNPPFKNGVKHALKAWEVLNNGNLICLLNSETIRNPYTRDRKYLLSLIEQYGSVEHIGQVFANENNERKTNVKACIVRLHKPKVKTNIKFELDSDNHKNDEFSASYLASADLIESLVAQYGRAVDITLERNKLNNELQFYMSGIGKDKDTDKIDISINEQIDTLKDQFWNYVFDKTQIGMRVTSDYRKKFEMHKTMVRNVSFTHKNISQVLQGFIVNQKDIMDECMNDVFLAITQHHHKNKVSEGWKTNKSWKINSKIIIPRGISHDKSRYSPWSTNYVDRDFYEDLDKVCCYLSNMKRENLRENIYDTLDKLTTSFNQGEDYQQYYTSYFFQIRMYKKGTVHLYFRDKKLCEDFNIAVAKNKRWIGNEY